MNATLPLIRLIIGYSHRKSCEWENIHFNRIDRKCRVITPHSDRQVFLDTVPHRNTARFHALVQLQLLAVRRDVQLRLVNSDLEFNVGQQFVGILRCGCHGVHTYLSTHHTCNCDNFSNSTQLTEISYKAVNCN